MNDEPGHPRWKAGQVEIADLANCSITANRRHRSLIPINEVQQGLPGDLTSDIFGDQLPLLNRHRREHRQGPSIYVFKARKITDRVDVGVLLDLQSRIDFHSATP